MEVAHIDAFHRDTRRFWSFYRPRFAELDEKQPNAAHDALAELEARGMLDAVITQNIDRLHTQGRLGPGDRGPRLDRDLELHHLPRQLSARERRRALRPATASRRCACCMGKVKPDVVLFGELLPEAAMAEAERSARAPTCCSASAPRSRSTRSPPARAHARRRRRASRSSPRARPRTTARPR